jgi:hypothetical protein
MNIVPLLLALSFDLAALPFDVNEACHPFHFSLGNTVIKLNDGAYAIACAKLGDNRREASEQYEIGMREYYQFNSLVFTGYSTHTFEVVGSGETPEKFYRAELSENQGEAPSHAHAIGNDGVFYILWLNGDCLRGWDKEEEVRIFECKGDT